MLWRVLASAVRKRKRKKPRVRQVSFEASVRSTIGAWTDPHGFRYVPRVLSVSNYMVVVTDVLSVTDAHFRLLINHVGATSIRVDFQTYTLEVGNALTEPISESFADRQAPIGQRAISLMRAVKQEEAGGDIHVEESEGNVVFTRIAQLTPRALASLLLLNVGFTAYLRTGTLVVLTSGRSAPSCVDQPTTDEVARSGEAAPCTTDAQ